METLNKIEERKDEKIAITKGRTRAENVKAQAEYGEPNKVLKKKFKADKWKYMGELATRRRISFQLKGNSGKHVESGSDIH